MSMLATTPRIAAFSAATTPRQTNFATSAKLISSPAPAQTMKDDEMTTDSVLAPCPFCGTPGELDDFSDHRSSRWYAGCNNNACKCEANVIAADKAEAVATWNARPALSPVAPAGASDEGIAEDIAELVDAAPRWFVDPIGATRTALAHPARTDDALERAAIIEECAKVADKALHGTGLNWTPGAIKARSMPEQTAEEIARGLTAPMKRAVLWLPPDGSWRDHRRIPKANDGVGESSLHFIKERIIGKPDRQAATIYRLARSDHASGQKERGQIWPNTRWCATPLGLQVRAILAGEGKTPHARSGE